MANRPLRELLSPAVYAAAKAERLKREAQARQRDLTPADEDSPYRRFQRKYRNRPDLFIQECIAWREERKEGPTEYQLEAALAVAEHRRVSLRGAHGLGKTSLAAWLILWFALTRDELDDWKVPTTASAWRQLNRFLWPEIHKWVKRLRWDVIGRPAFNERTELLDLNLKLSTGEAFALASSKAELIEGAHADQLFYLLDEAKAIDDPIWGAVEGAFSAEGGSSQAYLLAQSTPGAPVGKFFEIQTRRPGTEDWHVIYVNFERIVAAGRISRKWAAQRKREWGEESSLYLNRVLGEFSTTTSDGVIPLAWVEAANERYLLWKESGAPRPDFTALGVDVGRGGDPSTVARRYGWLLEAIEKRSTPNTMSLVGWVQGLLNLLLGGYTVIDVNGVGAGATDLLTERFPGRVYAFNSSNKTDARDSSGEFGFINQRAQMWWNMRELLDPTTGANLALEPDDELTGDLTAPKSRMASNGLKVEEKDEIRKRLGRSPDKGDAACMAFFPLTTLRGPAGRVYDYFKMMFDEQSAAEHKPALEN